MINKIAVTTLAIASILSVPAMAQVNLSAETGPPTGAPGASVIALSEVAAKSGAANIQVTTGQTLTNSIQNVAEGKTDIAASPFILPFLMSKGVGPYAKLGKDKGAALAEKLAVLYTYRVAVGGLYAYDSSNFGGWDDIKGSRIYNGPPRGAALTEARLLIKLNTGLEDGKGYTGIQVNWGQAVKTIQDGSADAFVLPMGFPDGRITAALASGDMTIFSVPTDVFGSESFQKVAGMPGTVGFEIPVSEMGYSSGVTVVTEDDNFRGLGTVGGEVVNVSMDFDTAKALTAAFIDGLDLYKAKAPFMASAWHGETAMEITDMCGALPIKYHPGAVAAWEDAGYTLPACAKP